MRRTKIVATLGPASRDPASIRKLISAGVDVFRLNYAHGSPRDHEENAERIRRVAREMGTAVGLLVDLPGPKMRTGPVADDRVALRTGAEFTLASEDVLGDEKRASTTVKNLADLVQPGEEVYLADGQIILQIEAIDGREVITEVVRGGILRSRKGMHLPSAERHVQAFTEQDADALRHALSFKADFIGLSFIRDEGDMERARAALPKRGRVPLLVAKIETRSALDNLEDIVNASDVVMVARGDLGIQTQLTRVPILQKQIIRACNRRGVPVITATQMLESMTRDPLPTRAEVGDVANAVIDGTDAVMLSEETAIGEYPVAAVETMAQIAGEVESAATFEEVIQHGAGREDRVSWAVSHAAVEAAMDLKVAAILCPTRSGATARRVAAHRPPMPIIGISSHHDTLSEITIIWGVIPLPMTAQRETQDEEVVEHAVQTALGAGHIKSGDLAAVVAGSPGPRAGQTDFVRIVRA